MVWKHRYTVLTVLVCAWLLCYLDRMVIASAIPFIAQDFKLSPLQMGQVMSAFFVGYAAMQIPGGLLADRFGPRVVLTAAIGWWSIMTALTGLVPGLISLLVVRVLFGLGEGPYPAGSSKAVSNWFPRRELARAQGLQMAATSLGATVAPLFVVTLITNWGWRSVFYSLFVPGVILGLVVWRYVRNSPAESPRVSAQELKEFDTPTVARTPTRQSFMESLRTPAVLWCAASLFFSNIVSWGLMNWLPTYLLQARGFSPEKMGVLAALTNLAGALGCPLGGYICDKYFKNNMRVPIIWGLFISAGFTYLAATAPTGEWAVVYLAVVFLIINGVATTAIFTLPLLIVPKHAVGGAFGVVNTAGQISGVLSPLLVGYILELTHNNFQTVLYFMMGLTIAAAYPTSRIRQSGGPSLDKGPEPAASTSP